MAHYQSLKCLVNYNQIIMRNSDLMKEYKLSNKLTALFSKKTQNYPPLTYHDSLSPVPNYPFCTLGVLNTQAEWGTRKGVAFVVEDNYLLTCASNCYSHQHGASPNITFTISSNRKHGSDTYKVAYVLIPRQYKTFALSTRNQHNQALLYIQGEPNLKDKYGSLKIVKEKILQNSFTYQCAINGQDELQMIAEHRISSKTRQMASEFLLNGMPRIKWNYTSAQVEGLIFQRSKNSLYLLKFGKNVDRQLAQWAREQKGWMALLRKYEVKYMTFLPKDWT